MISDALYTVNITPQKRINTKIQPKKKNPKKENDNNKIKYKKRINDDIYLEKDKLNVKSTNANSCYISCAKDLNSFMVKIKLMIMQRFS